MTMKRKRSFLFLQGPCGPYFPLLGKQLKNDGHSVLRINFNGGDVFQWHGPTSRNFPGLPQDWPDYLESTHIQHGITDLIVYGDCRPYHQKAIRLLKKKGVRIHVFEEGYFRPRWITLEKDGVNANSTLPGDPDYYLKTARSIKSPPNIESGKSFRHMFRHYFNYFFASISLGFLFPQYKANGIHPDSLRLFPAYHEAMGDSCRWAFRLMGARRMHKNAEKILDRFTRNGSRFYLAPLQLSIDSQITCHSQFKSMQGFISHVIQDFAKNAPEDSALLFKNHPLDPNVRTNRIIVELEANRFDLLDRVAFIDGGNLPAILQRSSGAVLINSTTGLSALHHNIPSITLGRAIYDMPGLTFQGKLGDFWTAAEPPDVELYRSFRNVVMSRTQINGSYYTPKGIKMALGGGIEKLSLNTALSISHRNVYSYKAALLEKVA